MTHVLCLVPYQVLPARFGGQKNIALFNKYLSFHVKLVCVMTRRNDPAAAEGYEVLNILSNSPLRYINPFYFFTLRKIIRQKKITHLVIEHPYYGWLAIMLKKFTGVRLIIHSHNIEGLRRKELGKWWWKILLLYERYTHRKADFTFFITEEDRDYAAGNFSLLPEKSMVITYGIEKKQPPAPEQKKAARQYVYEKHKIPSDHQLFLFNGSFGYAPNLHALEKIISIISPALQAQKVIKYSIIICGGNIPGPVSGRLYPDIIMAGFVENVEIYLMAADIFLNPVIEGGGIKTKIVEALGLGCMVVSTASGAAGMDKAVCGQALSIVPDEDWTGFTGAIIESVKNPKPVPAAYYEHYYWGNIVKKAVAVFR